MNRRLVQTTGTEAKGMQRRPSYPDVGPKSARGKRDDARLLVTDNIEPAEHRIFTKFAQIERAVNSFESITRERYAKYDPA